VSSEPQLQLQASRASALIGSHLQSAVAVTPATQRGQRGEPPNHQPTTRGGDHMQAYTVEQVAEMLHVGRDKVYYLLRSGQLRSIKIGKLRRITNKHLAEFIASLEGGS
jgi:excisionase family DNA binding protein